jgi:type I restriction enzyme S subunit
MLLRPNDSIDGRFLEYAFSADVVKRQYLPRILGTTAPHLNVRDIKQLNIPIAPAAEQQRIVEILEKLFSVHDAGVAALERVKAGLKRYRAAVLKAAVEGKLTADWRARHPAGETGADLLRRILDERRRQWEQEQRTKYAKAGKEPPKGWQAKYKTPARPEASGLPELPKGWCWAVVNQLGDVQLGRQRSPKNRSDRYPTKYIRAANITERGLSLNDVLEMDFNPNEREVYRLQVGDLVLSEASGSPDQAGKPAVWNGEIESCCFQNTVIRFRPQGIGSRYPLTIFRYCYFNKVFAQVASGVGINHLGAAKFSVIPFPLAPLDEQRVIVEEVERRLSIVEENEAQIEASLKRAARLRQSILKRAFEGRLVPQDPRDEPADKLLERIRRGVPQRDRSAGLLKGKKA